MEAPAALIATTYRGNKRSRLNVRRGWEMMQTGKKRGMKTFLFTLLAVAVLWQTVFARSRPTLNMSVIEGAKKEKKLVLYTTTDLPAVLNVASRFVRKYPFMQLELFPATDAALLEKIRNDARTGIPSWDVLSGDGSVLMPLLEQNMVAPYRSAQRAAITDGLMDRDGYWSGYYVSPYVLGYDTRALKRQDIPKTYEELLEPRWRGNQIAMDSQGHSLLSGLMRAWGHGQSDRLLARARRTGAKDGGRQRDNCAVRAARRLSVGDCACSSDPSRAEARNRYRLAPSRACDRADQCRGAVGSGAASQRCAGFYRLHFVQ